MDPFSPTREDKFSFGLWTVGNRGFDPFGEAVREAMNPGYIVQKLSELGAWGVNLHDNDLVPFGASAAERDRLVSEFRTALADHGMVVPGGQDRSWPELIEAARCAAALPDDAPD